MATQTRNRTDIVRPRDNPAWIFSAIDQQEIHLTS